jgi:hypothetical protein
LWANSSTQYDTLAIAPEDQASQVEQACSHCVYVYAHNLDPAAGRYAALYKLIHTVRWQTQMAGKYDYIYFPEEEIVQSVSSINRFGPSSLCKHSNAAYLLAAIQSLASLQFADCTQQYCCWYLLSSLPCHSAHFTTFALLSIHFCDHMLLVWYALKSMDLVCIEHHAVPCWSLCSCV